MGLASARIVPFRAFLSGRCEIATYDHLADSSLGRAADARLTPASSRGNSWDTAAVVVIAHHAGVVDLCGGSSRAVVVPCGKEICNTWHIHWVCERKAVRHRAGAGGGGLARHSVRLGSRRCRGRRRTARRVRRPDARTVMLGIWGMDCGSCASISPIIPYDSPIGWLRVAGAVLLTAFYKMRERRRGMWSVPARLWLNVWPAAWSTVSRMGSIREGADGDGRAQQVEDDQGQAACW